MRNRLADCGSPALPVLKFSWRRCVFANASDVARRDSVPLEAHGAPKPG